MGETNRNQAGVRARTAAIEAGGGFDPGELAFEETAEARKACVDAWAALLWDVADLSGLDQLVARKVAAWELEDAVYEQEPHLVPYEVSTAVDSPRNSRPDLLMPPRR